VELGNRFAAGFADGIGDPDDQQRRRFVAQDDRGLALL